MIHLVLGGARSGKSGFAERCATDLAAEQVLYIATAENRDHEMDARIAQHRAARNSVWTTYEASSELAAALEQSPEQACVLVDCLTLWLSRSLENGRWPVEKQQFMQALGSITRPLILVSNEVSGGITPMGELTRNFVDEAGYLHQDIAKIACKVTLVTAGLPLSLKG